MDRELLDLYQSLQKLLSVHRQLLDVVRVEREALLNADVKATQETATVKEGLINLAYQAESERQKRVTQLAVAMKKPIHKLSLSGIIREIETTHPNHATQYQNALTALTILVQRISEQNKENKVLAENLLTHVNQMKRNVLGEGQPHSGTYTNDGKKSAPQASSRFIAEEA